MALARMVCLLEEREYLRLMKLKLSQLKDVKQGTPEYLTDQNSIDYALLFWYVVENVQNNESRLGYASIDRVQFAKWDFFTSNMADTG